MIQLLGMAQKTFLNSVRLLANCDLKSASQLQKMMGSSRPCFHVDLCLVGHLDVVHYEWSKRDQV